MQYTRFIGIDPGNKGAVAVVDEHAQPIAVANFPATIAQLSLVLNAGFVSSRFVPVSSYRAAVEWPRAIPKESTSGAQTLGVWMGACEGILAACNVATERVDPRTWKRAVFFGTEYRRGPLDKKASISLANDLWGSGVVQGKDGRAEALLIARWICKKTQGEAHGKSVG